MKEYSTIVGMDLGDKQSNWALMVREDEEIQKEGQVPTTQEVMGRKSRGMASTVGWRQASEPASLR